LQEDGKILTRRMTKKYILAVEKHSRILWEAGGRAMKYTHCKAGWEDMAE
jgi:hypothetical protein